MKRGAALVALALAGCSPCEAPSDLVVVGGDDATQRAWAEAVATFETWTGEGSVCLAGVRSESNLKDLESKISGRYNETTNAILVSSTISTRSERNTFLHELCHAFDFESGFSSEYDRDIPAELNGYEPFWPKPDNPQRARRELFAELCAFGPVFSQRMRRFSAACGHEALDNLAERLLDEVFVATEDEWLSDREWPTQPIGHQSPPYPGAGFAGAIVSEGVGLLTFEKDDRVTSVTLDLWTGEPAYPFAVPSPPTGMSALLRTLEDRSLSTPFGLAFKRHLSMGPVVNVVIDPPGLPPAVVPMSVEREGLRPLRGVCGRSVFDPKPLRVDDLWSWEHPELPDVGSLAGGREPYVGVAGCMEGVWSFAALPDGSARWWFTPLELPPKLPDLTAPDLEEAERR